MSTLLPAADIAQAHAAIKAAMTYINDTREPGDRRSLDLWNDLNSARAFVKCYLLDKVPAVEVEVTSEVEEWARARPVSAIPTPARMRPEVPA